MGVGGWTTFKFDVADADCKQTLNMAYAQPWNFKDWDTTVNVKVSGKPEVVESKKSSSAAAQS